ncbi:MAG: DUF1566 domain-containing protein, partial [Proteobacteria bacterium]|nr:DUF1566 domain-containing protein [Pseudomonadota bacterium]
IELHSIVDYSAYGPSIMTSVFPGTVSWYWSSSTNADLGGYAFCVNFDSGNNASSQKSTDGNYIRCVRGGE